MWQSNDGNNGQEERLLKPVENNAYGREAGIKDAPAGDGDINRLP
ncbi:MAG: hypothetical protein PHY02_06440 [Phycisphaerae bacterium]|nr:hypothetical protein [Phycisphaerae bacterium]